MKKRGFSAIEIMIGLSLSLLVFLSAVEFFGLSRNIFLKLKKAEEANQSAMAALDKIKIDLLRAGFGLIDPTRHGTIECLTLNNNVISISLLDAAHSLQEDILAGDTQVILESAAGLSPGREVCVSDEEKSELRLVSSRSGDTVFLSAPLDDSYSKSNGRMLLLEKITLF
ncbi:MAG: hypothetical protein AB1715_13615, partial [Acidobacteriota bacterium]